MSQIRGDLF